MTFDDHRVVITAAGRDFGRTLAIRLTAQSLVDCILFALAQPRDCFIKAFHFEQV